MYAIRLYNNKVICYVICDMTGVLLHMVGTIDNGRQMGWFLPHRDQTIIKTASIYERKRYTMAVLL